MLEEVVRQATVGTWDVLDALGSFVAGLAALAVLLWELSANRKRHQVEEKQTMHSY
ncbi:hypothetical protein EV138_2749 [Kribbella voronezhensis]|uniref:Uncharacterized protein n=1 Tax=Kribbella voronezhensis TaxID=2512212 RepID=A0A4R7TBX4_9ACTN|nr:hypothetical protein EV138_2749 [Kribbella voronezhensis]